MRWLRVIWYVLTLRCEEADRVRSYARKGEQLRPGSRVGEWLHSSLCSNCRRARKRLRELDRLVAELRQDPDAAPAGAMPPDARARILDAIQKTRENDE
ncbi:MAG: hypothetical protein R3B57_06365 [Phycisphaerales bacterium]